MFAIHSFYRSVSSKNLLSVFLCCFKKSDALYLLATIWLLLIVIDKFTIIEFAPFSLVTKGVFVTFGKICLYVKSHSFIFSVIPCCLLSFKTERTFPLIFAVVVNTSFAGQINLRFCNFYLVSFLLMLFLFFSLFFKKFTHIEMKVWRHRLFIYLLFTILHEYSIVQNFKEPMKVTETASASMPTRASAAKFSVSCCLPTWHLLIFPD